MNPQKISTPGEPRLTPQNPWPGLAAFTAENHEFFFGREAEIAEIFRRVRRQLLTVLFGVSGLGKTSLLQAGLLPRLGGTPFHPILIRLDHRPEAEDLVEQLRAAINHEIPRARNAGVQIPRGPELGEDLWGYLHDKTTDWHNAKGEMVFPVLIFDQFEEIFTHESRTRETEERRERFVELLSCLAENRVPDALAREMETHTELAQRYDFRQDDFRVVISLREDFLAHLESFKLRMPSVMENRMRLKRMSEEQALQAVLGPGKEIVESSVAREIVAFVAGNARNGKGAGDANAPISPAEADPVLLSLLCEQLNRLRLERKQERITADLLTQEREGIIQGFYEQSFAGLDERVREWVEDELLTAGGYRDHAALEDALQQGLSAAEMEELEKRRILHLEKRGGVMWLELTHDLLCEPAARSRALRKQRQQAEEAAAREAAAVKRERELRRQKGRWKLAFGALLLATLVSVGLILRHMYDYDWLYVRYYANFTQHFGIPDGVGLLDANQVMHRSESLKFTYRGKNGRLVSMQAVDGAGHLTPYNDVSTYFNFDASQNRDSRHACQWEYVLDTKGRISYEMAYDKETNLVWGLDYSPPTSDKPLRREAHFVGANGFGKSQLSSKTLATSRSAANYLQIDYSQDGLEKKVSYLDWFGNPQPGPNGEFSDEMGYSNGMPCRIESLNAQGQPMRDYTKTTTRILIRNQLGNITEEDWLDADGRKTFTTNGFAEVKMSYDDLGNLVEWACFDIDGAPAVDRTDGIHMSKMEYDNQGNKITWACFDTNDAPTVDLTDGKHMAKVKYDDQGNQIEYSRFGTNGQPANCDNGYSTEKMKYDDRGDLIEWACFGTNGAPAIDLSDGKHMAKMTYDDLGNKIEWDSFGTNGQPADVRNGYAKETMRYDDRGDLVEWACFDTNGAPAIDRSDGTHMTKMKYDSQGNRVAWECFGKNDSPINYTGGYAKEVMSYDAGGNRIKWECFDTNGQPVDCDGGYAEETMNYDDRGNLVEWSCFDTNGAPTWDLTDGKHTARMKYDSQGNRIEWECLDIYNHLADDNNGYARETMSYDSRGNLIEWACFDTNGAPCVDLEDGKHMAEMKYDKHDDQIEWESFDVNGNPVDSKYGYARKTTAYDEFGNITEEAYFGASGEPATNQDGCVRTMKHYDNQNRVIEESDFYKPDKDGYAEETTRYDSRNNPVEVLYFNANGEPADSVDGYARKTISYDSLGDETEEDYFDASGHLVDIDGYAKKIMSYDGRGNETGEAYFNASGNPVEGKDGYARKTMRYDGLGNETEEAYYDASGNPAESLDGYARKVMSYDSHGNETEEAYFNESGKLVNGIDGYARETMRYDSQSNLVEETQFFSPATNGYASKSMSYDQKGNETEEDYFDESGNPMNSLDGYAKKTMSYDTHSDLVEISYFNTSGNPANCEDGYASKKTIYDETGDATEESFFNTSGQFVNTLDGYAKILLKYDDRGDLIEWSCYDAGGAPAIDVTDGTYMTKMKYDDQGNRIEWTYFDMSGQPVNCKNGFARETKSYDAHGNPTEISFYDPAGNLTNNKYGYARETMSYDNGSALTEDLFFDASGKQVQMNN
ncbi:MAG TPA: hypothetical protein VMB22_06765 [Verrucomicrobiae bacterium]|nr:hypothetical protein [Verrucomicrobiae bacterium]